MAERFAKFRTVTGRHALLAISIAILVAGLLPPPKVAALPLTQRSIRVNSALAAQGGVTYRVAFSTIASSTIGSVRIEFCANTSLPDEPCVPPTGFDISNASLTTQSGITGFTISGTTTANSMVISRPPAVEVPNASLYIFTGVTNPLNGGPQFARISTYPTSDGSGPSTDFGGLALYYQGGVGVMAEVPPYLRFCLGENITGFDCNTATEPFSDIGILGPLVTGSAQSQMVVATNADGGYSLWVQGGTMASGNNVIPAMAGVASQQGVSQFGINMRANTSPVIGQNPTGPGLATVTAGYNQQNVFRYQSGDMLATTTDPDDNLKYTVSYIVNVASSQPGGVYATTLTYIALANF